MRSASRFVFLGHPSRFSLAALEALLEAGVTPCAVVQHGRPARAGAIPVRVEAARPASPAELAAARGIETLWLSSLATHTAEQALAALRADLFLVACFPALLPARIRQLPSRACLNLHPSLLPRYRGPAPLFWQFRNDECAFGITLHHLSARVDSGPIVAQRRVALAYGIGHAEASAVLGRSGAGLFTTVLARYPRGALPAAAQDEAAATRQPPPRERDFTLSTDWPARRAYAFMRGTAGWGRPYPVDAGGRLVLLSEALEVRDRAPRGGAGDGTVWVEFSDGALLARLVDHNNTKGAK